MAGHGPGGTEMTPEMNDSRIREMLSQAETIAIVGAKDVPGSPVDRVGRYLIEAGYDVLPVHPKRARVWGLDAYPSLSDVDRAVDIVDVFRAPQFCADHARECTVMRPLPSLFWMQLGIKSQDAVEILSQGPVGVVQDRCLMVEHRRLLED